MRDADLDAAQSALTQVLARWERSASKSAVYGDELIPAAAAVLETTLADFALDKAMFSDLFDAEVALLDLERARIKAVVDTHVQAALARQITGDATLGGAQ